MQPQLQTLISATGLKVAKGIMLTSGGGGVPRKHFFMNTKI